MSSIRGCNFVLLPLIVLILLVRTIYMETAGSVGDGVVKAADDEPDDDQPHSKLKHSGRMRPLSFRAPNLTEEDEHAFHMPSALKCDGCRIIAFKFSDKFHRTQTKFKDPSKRLSESDIIDIVDGVCQHNFEEYGIKEINGVKRFSGPGLKTEDSPGMKQGGGKWPGRLNRMCKEYIGEVEEETLYDVFLSKKPLEDFLCRGEGLLSACHQQILAPTKKERRAKVEL